ncbi:hypothetical protein GpartN1_g2433.t1 [Galdieria partita]|uniref:Large ribosomal subunit protein mL54 n=1 Tax=Galdieria partita TaxID=83374 RepID=A0A9C7UPM0_9RHOD|nr:hypothetical protein GpartN1_g2433.t1 [Galdieria partita]
MSHCSLSFVRKLATKAKSPKKSSSSTTLANLPSGWEALNYFKDGKPPELKVDAEDKEYPEWLFSLKSRRATLEDLVERVNKFYAQGGVDAVAENIPWSELRRMFRLANIRRIRRENKEKAEEF